MQMGVWKFWFDTTLTLGLRWFSITLPGDGGYRTRVCRYLVDTVRERNLAPGVFEVTADLEVRGYSGTVDDGQLNALRYVELTIDDHSSSNGDTFFWGLGTDRQTVRWGWYYGGNRINDGVIDYPFAGNFSQYQPICYAGNTTMRLAVNVDTGSAWVGNDLGWIRTGNHAPIPDIDTADPFLPVIFTSIPTDQPLYFIFEYIGGMLSGGNNVTLRRTLSEFVCPPPANSSPWGGDFFQFESLLDTSPSVTYNDPTVHWAGQITFYPGYYRFATTVPTALSSSSVVSPVFQPPASFDTSSTLPTYAPGSGVAKLKVAALDYTGTTTTARRDLLAKFPFVVFGWTRGQIAGSAPSFMDSVKAINPTVLMAQYVLFNELKDPQTNTEDRYPYWTQVNTNNWWAYKSDGSTKVQWTTAFGNHEINILHPTADGNGRHVPQAKAKFDYDYYLQYIKTRVNYIFHDNFWAQPRTIADYFLSGVNTPYTDPTLRDKWQQAELDYVTALKSYGFSIIGNVDGVSYDNGLTPAKYQQLLEGAFYEGAFGKSYSPQIITGYNSLMNNYRALMANTKAPHWVLVNAYGVSTNYKLMRYGLCMTLMDDGYFCYIDETGGLHPVYFDEYDQDIGNPTETYRTAAFYANGVWRRFYERGMVLANPTSSSQTVTIPSGYRRFSGTQDATTNDGSSGFTSVTLAAKDGLLLLTV